MTLAEKIERRSLWTVGQDEENDRWVIRDPTGREVGWALHRGRAFAMMRKMADES